MTAITCPYCGTSYSEFQANCDNCGGVLPHPDELAQAKRRAKLSMPPEPPRDIKGGYLWRMLFRDSSFLGALIIGAVGAFFALQVLSVFSGGFGALSVVCLGVLGAGGGAYVCLRRYGWAVKQLRVLREGRIAVGEIAELELMRDTTIAGRHPWRVYYQFELEGEVVRGEMTTLNRPGPELTVGNPAVVLYLEQEPMVNGLWPRP